MIRQTTSNPRGHTLSESQVRAIQSAMRLFVEDDLTEGQTAERRLYCDACQRAQPAAGFIHYCRYQICNTCATEYELAKARGLARSAGQFVRDRQFGETLDLLFESDAPAVASDSSNARRTA